MIGADSVALDAQALEPDASCVRELQRIAALLRDGRPGDALEQAQRLFAAEAHTPAWRIADLCKLSAEAAQQVGLAPLAETLWRQAAAHAHDPHDAADAHANLAVLLAGARRADEAQAACRSALALNPDHVVALANLAVLLADSGAKGAQAEAEACHRRVLELDPANTATLANLGVLLAATDRADEAERSYRRALALDPDDACAHTNLGLLLHDQARLDEAEPHQRRALALAPHSAPIHSNLGNLLARRGDARGAEACLRRALELDPAWPTAHANLGTLLADQYRDAEAEHHLRRAIELRPGYPLARLNLGQLLLAQGRFDEGWPLHEARHDPLLPDGHIDPPPIDLPMWRGEPLAGRALLVWLEQGYGDQIQFCRHVAQLKARGAARVTLVCRRALVSLFETLAGVDRVLGADIVDNAFQVDPALLGGHDCWTYLLSLPALLHTDLASLPQVSMPYLHAAPERARAWAQRFANDDGGAAGFRPRRIGLVWRGNPLHHNDTERSLPGLATLAPLGTVGGVRFISLQTGRAGAALGESTGSTALPLLPIGAELSDFAETAAALAALDLLISVDTSIAHLAGALGLPCWVLLPQHRTDWRWLRGRDDSPWYPLGMRLFRQAARGDWADVIERVRAALEVFAQPPR